MLRWFLLLSYFMYPMSTKNSAQHQVKPHINGKCDTSASCDSHTEWFSLRQSGNFHQDILGRKCSTQEPRTQKQQEWQKCILFSVGNELSGWWIQLLNNHTIVIYASDLTISFWLSSMRTLYDIKVNHKPYWWQDTSILSQRHDLMLSQKITQVKWPQKVRRPSSTSKDFLMPCTPLFTLLGWIPKHTAVAAEKLGCSCQGTWLSPHLHHKLGEQCWHKHGGIS
jgi:hypothetical protein